MRRINLRDVPDDVYDALAAAAEENRQSLNAYVVDRLEEAARVARAMGHMASYPAPSGTGVTVEDVVEALHEVREAS